MAVRNWYGASPAWVRIIIAVAAAALVVAFVWGTISSLTDEDEDNDADEDDGARAHKKQAKIKKFKKIKQAKTAPPADGAALTPDQPTATTAPSPSPSLEG